MHAALAGLSILQFNTIRKRHGLLDGLADAAVPDELIELEFFRRPAVDLRVPIFDALLIEPEDLQVAAPGAGINHRIFGEGRFLTNCPPSVYSLLPLSRNVAEGLKTG